MNTDMDTELSAIPKFKPLGILELLDQAFRIYRHNFIPFLGIVGAVYVPWALLYGVMIVLINMRNPDGLPYYYSSTLVLMIALTLGLILVILIGAILLLIAGAAMTQAVVGFYLGEPISFTQAYQSAAQKTGKLIRLWGWGIGMGVVAFAWLAIPCIGWITGLGLVYFCGITYALALPVVVVEDLEARPALRRAFDMARRNFWSVVATFALLGVLTYVLTTASAALANVLINVVFDTTANVVIFRQIAQQASGSLVNLFILPFSLTLMVLVYFDLRVRFEGFDLSWIAEHLLDPLATADTVATRTPMAPPDPIGANDLLNFLLLGLAGAGVCGMVIALVLGYIAFVGTLMNMIFGPL